MMLKEYFIYSASFAAPFVSDFEQTFAVGETPLAALQSYVESYSHPCGLFAAAVYEDANAFHKNKMSLHSWLSNKAAGKPGPEKEGSYT